MPNLNVKGETPRAASAASAGGGGGVPKIVITLIIVIVVLAGAAFVLNTTGIVKLWGKKKPQPVVVSTPIENFTPATQEPAPQPVMDTAAVNPAVEENLTKLESNAGVPVSGQPKKMIVTGTGMFTIQISSWPTQEKAEHQAQLFADAGFEAFVEPLGSYYRVCIGRYESKSAARTQAGKMEHMLESMPVISKVAK